MRKRPFGRGLLSASIAATTAAAVAVPAYSAKLNEITVTANKRPENVQDISASITALDSDAIERAGIVDITRLELVVPGLRVGRSGGEVRPAMRGARTNEVGVAGTGIAEQVVGIFQDGIYVPTTTAGLGAYVDIARIEVLRGPQGTLYGRNTFAGTINVISNQPDFDAMSGSIKILHGDYNRAAYTGILNMPLSDKMATRLVVASDKHDGYIENDWVQGPSDDLREKDQFYARATTKYNWNDNVSSLLRVDFSTKDSNSEAIWGYQQIYGFQIDETAPGSGVFLPDARVTEGHIYRPADSFRTDGGPWNVDRNAISRDQQETLSITKQVEWNADFADVKVTGNFSKLSGQQFYDNDYSDGGLDFVGGFGRQDDQKTWSLETQFTSNDEDSNLQWVGGIYYFDQEADWEWLWRADSDGDGIEDRIVVPSWGNPFYDPHRVQSFAVYGQATLAISDTVRLIGGLRYNDDEKSFTGDISDWDDDAVLWKAAVEVDASDDVMYYASAATGYRTGGANDARVVARGAPELYDNEEVISYELGVKSTLLDGAMTLNLSLFMNEYEDVKAQLFAVACNDPMDVRTVVQCVDDGASTTFEYYENGGDSDTMGFEADMQWAATEDLLITATFAWIDAEFDDNYEVGNALLRPLLGLGNIDGRQDVNDPNSSFSFGGWTPALTPEFTLGVSATYDIKLKGSTLSPSLFANFVDDYYVFDTNIDEAEQDAHVIVDSRVTWRPDDSGFEVEAFVLNMGDQEVITRGVVHSQIVDGLPANSLQVNWNNPRTWGVSVTYNFEE